MDHPSDSHYSHHYDYDGQQQHPSSSSTSASYNSFDRHQHQYYDHPSYDHHSTRHHHQQSSYYQEPSSRGNSLPYHYLQRGHRHSTDSASAAADTLLMLSAAAFMDPDAIRLVMTTSDDKQQRTGTISAPTDDGDLCSNRTSTFAEEHHHRPQPMAKTVSAPASSSSRPPLPILSRMPRPPRELVEETDMDIDFEPSIAGGGVKTVCSTGSQTLITKEPSSSGTKHLSASSSRLVSPTVISSATASVIPSSAASTTGVSSNGRNGAPVSSSFHVGSKDMTQRAGMSVDPTSRHSLTKSGTGYRVKEEQDDEDEQFDEDEDEEEDEVMSEGVVHVNSHLAPVALSPQSKTPLPPLILTSGSALSQQQQSQQQQPKTPTSAKAPRTPKQAARTPKTPRATKRSQNDIPGSGGGSGVPSSRGKNNARDSSVDYFYSPFPPSTSPSSSPSSSSSFQAQLQQLTHNFVSIQPHASPTSRFRRTPVLGHLSNATPPFSPPASPGLDLMRDSLFYAGSSSTHSSPTKSHGSQSTATTPTSAVFPRSGSATGTKTSCKPRWHTQPYMMFLALRAMPNRTAARQELIMAAVELDKKFSAEKGLPRVFTGKTPMNSASACLTNNGDKYFIPFKPEGSRSTHFRLAYQPCDFDTAVSDYNNWMEELIRHDWPLCFGVPKTTATIEGSDSTSAGDAASRPDLSRMDSDSRKRGPDSGELAQELLSSGGTSKKIKAANDTETGASSLDTTTAESDVNHNNSNRNNGDHTINRKATLGVRPLDLDATTGPLDEANSCPPTPTAATALALERGLKLEDSPVIVSNSNSGSSVKKWRPVCLEDLDLSRVPSSLAEIVEVKESRIPHAGNGLFAKIDLPAGTPLGFYFGVPMTENEFDSLKEGVGAASQYSIMYRRTVLDATDEQGQPFRDPQGELFCPFHCLNEDVDGNVSFITGSVVNQVICTTNRPVRAGDELVVFFAKESDRHWPVVAAATASASASSGAAAGSAGTAAAGFGSGPGQGGANDRWSRDAGTSSPSGRPRRETVYKPARYTR
ncbi:hypothetical protein BGX29_011481 [Mortierella sp. GBA35]|nr:hypothetical protein BGX29_011481 [Mortierella sp. GBA35]